MTDTPIAKMVAKMLSANCPAEIIVMAIETAEAAAASSTKSSDDLVAKRDRLRQYDRERKARKAAEKNGISVSDENALLLTSSLSKSVIKEEGRKEESKSVIPVPTEIPTEKPTKRKKGFRLPADWRPSDHHYAVGNKQHGMDRAAVDARAQAMRDWTVREAHRAVTLKSDWDLTFTSVWLKPQDQKNGFGGSRPLQDDSRSASRAAARLAEEARAGRFAFAPLPSLLPRKSGDDVQLLPQGRGAQSGDLLRSDSGDV